MKQINFNNITELSEDDIDQLTQLITYRCRIATINKIRSRLKYSFNYYKNRWGIMERLILEDGQWTYCAGQSEPDEIRTVRELIIKG